MQSIGRYSRTEDRVTGRGRTVSGTPRPEGPGPRHKSKVDDPMDGPLPSTTQRDPDRKDDPYTEVQSGQTRRVGSGTFSRKHERVSRSVLPICGSVITIKPRLKG